MNKQDNNNNERKNDENFYLGGSSGSNFINGDKIYILGAFDDSISERIVPEFISLVERKSQMKESKIEIYINSHGGDADILLSLLSIIAIAKKNGVKIITYNIGVANSCGSILFIHGDRRIMFRNATNIMHLGLVNSRWTTFEQIDRVTTRSRKWFNTIVKWYIDNTKMKKDEITKILKDDQFCLDAEQCLKYGLCDEII